MSQQIVEMVQEFVRLGFKPGILRMSASTAAKLGIPADATSYMGLKLEVGPYGNNVSVEESSVPPREP